MTPRQKVEKYAQYYGIDEETTNAVIAVVEEMREFTPTSKPREKLAYCSLADIVSFQEQGV